jgi:hypothetical protein
MAQHPYRKWLVELLWVWHLFSYIWFKGGGRTMKDNLITIACVTVIILLILTAGCTTTQVSEKSNYQLMPSPNGLIRFNNQSGKTEFLIQTPAGMRWMAVKEGEVEVIPVPVPQRSSMPGAHWDGLD